MNLFNELALDILVCWPGKFMKFHVFFLGGWFFGGCFWWSWGVMCIDRAQGANFWLCQLALAWWFSSPGSFQVKSAEMKEMCFSHSCVQESVMRGLHQECKPYVYCILYIYICMHMYRSSFNPGQTHNLANQLRSSSCLGQWSSIQRSMNEFAIWNVGCMTWVVVSS